MMIQGRRISLSTFRELLNIPMIAIVTGLILAICHVTVPSFVAKLCDSLANMASPLAMLYIGMLIPDLVKRHWSAWSSTRLRQVRMCVVLAKWTTSEAVRQFSIPLMMKLLVLPIGIALLIYLTTFHGELTQVILVQSSMPTLTSSELSKLRG